MINDKKLLLQNYKLKILYFTLILLAASFFLYTWYVDISQTINVVMNTEYPGKRDVTQKPYSFYQLFTEPFFNFISPEKCPPQLMNICEASNFYLFFPYLFVFLYYVVKNKDYKKQYDILFLTLFCVVLTLIAAIGIHPFIAKVTLFNLVTLDRISYTLGTASMIAIFIYLSKNAPIKCNNVLIVLIIIVFSVILSLYVNSSLNNYFTSNQTIMAALILIIGFLCLHFKGKKYVTEAFLILLLLLNIKNLYSNPPTAGLNSIIKNPVFKEIRQYVSQNPKHTWLVYGQATYANFIKTTGAIVINGTKFSPNNDLMKSINNSDDAKSVYNRYGHISVNLLGSTIDTAIFQKNSDDAFSIYVDPCSNKIKNLKIDRYIFFTQPPNDAILCLELDTSFKSLLVYYSK
ncbi:MAG: hypothetical protein NW207_01245 [Cytophagales bacterium]|nr:hypothetical protein [Cytophagales bacterium]